MNYEMKNALRGLREHNTKIIFAYFLNLKILFKNQSISVLFKHLIGGSKDTLDPPPGPTNLVEHLNIFHIVNRLKT